MLGETGEPCLVNLAGSGDYVPGRDRAQEAATKAAPEQVVVGEPMGQAHVAEPVDAQDVEEHVPAGCAALV